MSKPVEIEEPRLSISQAAPLLDRSPHTIRSWDRNKSMPESLKPPRDSNGHRYWTKTLISEILEWIEANEFHPGRGIDYHPDGVQLATHIARIRKTTQAKVKKPQAAPHEEEFAKMVAEAIDPDGDLKITPDALVGMLPGAIKQYPGLRLDDALRIASGIFSQFR